MFYHSVLPEVKLDIYLVFTIRFYLENVRAKTSEYKLSSRVLSHNSVGQKSEQSTAEFVRALQEQNQDVSWLGNC